MEASRDLTGVELLDRVRGARREAERAEVRAVEFAVAFAHLHGPQTGQAPARLDHLHDIPLAGEGTPTVQEEAVAELAAALHLSSHAARSYLGDALELAHRLPRLWHRVREGEIPLYRARLVAAQTLPLAVGVAAHVDATVAPLAHKIGPTRLLQLIEEALALHDPATATARAAAAAERRHATLCTRTPVHGQVDMIARLDQADALDLDAALASVAHQLRCGGDTDPLAVRRARALGVLARQHLTCAAGAAAGSWGRRVQLYVHLDDESSAAGMARLEQRTGTALATVAQVREWCTTAGTTVRITPVIDLNHHDAHTGYAPTERLVEQTILKSFTCAHPYCTRAARRADIDHIHAWLAGGATASHNLAPLCRTHHRLKTHSPWTYFQIRPGVYVWRTPTGRRFSTTRDGTDELPP